MNCSTKSSDLKIKIERLPTPMIFDDLRERLAGLIGIDPERIELKSRMTTEVRTVGIAICGCPPTMRVCDIIKAVNTACAEVCEQHRIPYFAP